LQRGDGIGEEHRAELREDEIKTLSEVGSLDVGDLELHVDVLGLGFPPGGGDESIGGIDANGKPLCFRECCQLPSRIPKSAADVEYPVAALWRVESHRFIAVAAEARYDDVSVLDEPLEQGAVPCLDGFGVAGG
jgi:hypothetical protein